MDISPWLLLDVNAWLPSLLGDTRARSFSCNNVITRELSDSHRVSSHRERLLIISDVQSGIRSYNINNEIYHDSVRRVLQLMNPIVDQECEKKSQGLNSPFFNSGWLNVTQLTRPGSLNIYSRDIYS